MKNALLWMLGVGLLALVALGVYVFGFAPATHTARDQSLPAGYVLDTYSVVEVSDQACTSDTECSLPFDYAIRSNCPYRSLCLQNSCTVVCPESDVTENRRL